MVEKKFARWRRPPHIAAATILVAATVFWMYLADRLWFFMDDFTPLYHRALTWHDLNVPHNEHWSALPYLLFKLVQGAADLTYFPYALLPVLAHIGAAGVFYWLLVRGGLRPWAAVATLAIFAFAANGDNILWAFQVGYLASVALGLLAIASVDEFARLKWQSLLAGALLVLALSSSSVGVTMLIWVGVYALMRRGIAAALACTVPAGLVYVLWYLVYDPVSGERETALDLLGPFWWRGAIRIWDVLLGVQGIGLIMLLVLSAGALLLPATPRVRALAVSGIACLAPTYLILAVSRAANGVQYADTSRYVYSGLVLMVPALAVCLHHASLRLPGSKLQRTCVAVCVTAVVVVTQVSVTLAFAKVREGELQSSFERIVAGRQLWADADVIAPSTARFDPVIPKDVMLSDEFLEALPIENDLEPGPQAVADAQALLQLSSGAEDPGLPPADGAEVAGVAGVVGSNCKREYGSDGPFTVVVQGTPKGVQVAMAVPAESVLVEFLSGPIASYPARATALVGPDELTYIATSAPDVWMRITVPDGPIRLCNP